MIENADAFLEQMGLGELLANFKLRIISEIYDLLWFVKNDSSIQSAYQEFKKFVDNIQRFYFNLAIFFKLFKLFIRALDT